MGLHQPLGNYSKMFLSCNAVLSRANCEFACQYAQTDISLSNTLLFVLISVSLSAYFYNPIIVKSNRQNIGIANRAVSTVVKP